MYRHNHAKQDDRAEIVALVVGAGPTGLTLACELARSGVAFRLIEAERGSPARIPR